MAGCGGSGCFDSACDPTAAWPVGPVAGKPYRQFEKEAPNLSWQMDFKGHTPLQGAAAYHPLTNVDDHSSFSSCLAVGAEESWRTVKTQFETAFRRYGLPGRYSSIVAAPGVKDSRSRGPSSASG